MLALNPLPRSITVIDPDMVRSSSRPCGVVSVSVWFAGCRTVTMLPPGLAEAGGPDQRDTGHAHHFWAKIDRARTRTPDKGQ